MSVTTDSTFGGDATYESESAMLVVSYAGTILLHNGLLAILVGDLDNVTSVVDSNGLTLTKMTDLAVSVDGLSGPEAFLEAWYCPDVPSTYGSGTVTVTRGASCSHACQLIRTTGQDRTLPAIGHSGLAEVNDFTVHISEHASFNMLRTGGAIIAGSLAISNAGSGRTELWTPDSADLDAGVLGVASNATFTFLGGADDEQIVISPDDYWVAEGFAYENVSRVLINQDISGTWSTGLAAPIPPFPAIAPHFRVFAIAIISRIGDALTASPYAMSSFATSDQ